MPKLDSFGVGRLILVLVALLLAGCGTTGKSMLSPTHPNDAFDDDAYKVIVQSDMKRVAQLEMDYFTQPEAKRLDIRNEIVTKVRKHTDEYWRRFKSSFFGRTAAAMSATEIVSGTLSAAAAITSPPEAASILAALSTVTLAGGSSFQKNFLQENAAEIVLAQVEIDRRRIGAVIDAGVRSSSDNYPLAKAMADLQEYATCMSIPSALASIRANVGSVQKLQMDAAFPAVPAVKAGN